MPTQRQQLAQATNDLGQGLGQMLRTFGFRKTVWLLDFSAAWTIAVKDNGWEPIDAEQYAAFWKKGRAQGYRDQAKWRQLMPGESTPNDRALRFKAEYDRMQAAQQHEPDRSELANAFAMSFS
jgi:hypothetical protein